MPLNLGAQNKTMDSEKINPSFMLKYCIHPLGLMSQDKNIWPKIICIDIKIEQEKHMEGAERLGCLPCGVSDKWD